MRTKILPQNLTSYDILKSIALLLMVVDHVGYYLMPDTVELRWVGRFAAPVWLFLIGFAHSRALDWRLFAGAGVLQSMKLWVSAPFLAVDILFSIVLIRLVLDPVMRFVERSRWHMVAVVALLLVLALPSYYIVMYGTLGLMLAMFGAMVRRGDCARALLGFGAVTVFAYVCVAMIEFSFSLIATQILIVLVSALLFGLSRFKAREYAKCPKILGFLLKIGGRHSLAFYVLHLILFMAIAAALKIGEYHFI